MEISAEDLKLIKEGYITAYKVIMKPTTKISDKKFNKVDIGLTILNRNIRSKNND